MFVTTHLPLRGLSLRHVRQSHKELVDGVLALAARVQSDRTLRNLIRRKFAIKCTTGYSLNALVDFPLDDPIEIIKRLMIGSEGTLGFVSRATYNTVPEWPHKVPARCTLLRWLWRSRCLLMLGRCNNGSDERCSRGQGASSDKCASLVVCCAEIGVRGVPGRALRVRRRLDPARRHGGGRCRDVRSCRPQV